MNIIMFESDYNKGTRKIKNCTAACIQIDPYLHIPNYIYIYIYIEVYGGGNELAFRLNINMATDLRKCIFTRLNIQHFLYAPRSHTLRGPVYGISINLHSANRLFRVVCEAI